MARLLAADIEAVGTHVLDHVAVADLGAVELQVQAAEETLEPEIGHDGRDHAAAGEAAGLVPGLGDHRHDLVAVDDLALFVDDDDAVGVAVQRDADVGAHFMHLLLQFDGMGRAAFLVDVEAVRLDADGHHLGAEFPKRGRRDLVGGAVGAVDDDAQARQRHGARQGALGEFDVAVVHAVDALGAAEPVGIGERHLDVGIQHPLDAVLDLVGKLEAVRPEQLDAVVVVGIVRGRDHHAHVGAQGMHQHRHGRRRDRAEQEHVHAGGAQARDQRVFDHVARQAGVLAEDDAMAMASALEGKAGGHADAHGDLGGHGELVGSPANAIGAEITSCHHLSSLAAFHVARQCHNCRAAGHHIV